MLNKNISHNAFKVHVLDVLILHLSLFSRKKILFLSVFYPLFNAWRAEAVYKQNSDSHGKVPATEKQILFMIGTMFTVLGSVYN